MPFPIMPVIAGGMALGGGLMSLLGKSRKPKMTEIQKYTPEQRSALNSLLSQGMMNTDFGPIEQRARSQFSSQTIPSLAERFTSMGEGSQGSSAFAGQLGRASSDLESQLAGLRSQFGLQQLMTGLTPQYEPYVEQGGPGTMQSMGMGLMGAGMGAMPQALNYNAMRNSQLQQLLGMMGSAGGGSGYALGGSPYSQGGF